MNRVRAWMMVVMMVVLALSSRVRGDVSSELSEGQRLAILEDAQVQYDRGIEIRQSDPQRAAGHFDDSARLYELLIEDGVRNGYLHYNLGNAWLQAGEVGRAILNYRRAEQYIAGDARLEHNLAAARDQCRTQIRASGGEALSDALLGWHRNTATSSRFVVFAASYVLFWILLVGRLVRPHRMWRAGAMAAGALWLVCGASVAADVLVEPDQIGVLIEDDVVLRKGDGEGFEPQVVEPLHQGVEFEVIEARGEWLRVALADGNEGWVRAAQAGVVR